MVLDESRNAFNPWPTSGVLPHCRSHIPYGWDTWLAHDFGSAAPSVTYIIAKSPDAEYEGRFYPRDSLLLVDELAVVRRDSLTQGLGWTAATTAEAIREMCDLWKVKPTGAADDACFAKGGHGSGSIADEFARAGVRFYPAKKADRITGWNLMRRLLSDAGQVDRPGLYISRSCEYFWATVPYLANLARDTKRVEDVDSSGPDHAADATRYGILRRSMGMTVAPLIC
jgi:hypothetical protein